LKLSQHVRPEQQLPWFPPSGREQASPSAAQTAAHCPSSPQDSSAAQEEVAVHAPAAQEAGVQASTAAQASPQAVQLPAVPSGVQVPSAQQTEPVGQPPGSLAGTGVDWQPSAGSQTTTRQGATLGQTVALRTQAPPTQSYSVHASDGGQSAWDRQAGHPNPSPWST
jgi:hypothetical protein